MTSADRVSEHTRRCTSTLAGFLLAGASVFSACGSDATGGVEPSQEPPNAAGRDAGAQAPDAVPGPPSSGTVPGRTNTDAGVAVGDSGGATPARDGMAPVGAAGVVADGACVALCANAITDPDGDGWGFELNASCIVPGSGAAMGRLACVVGSAVAPVAGPPRGTPGVVVALACVAMCGPGIPDDGTGWGWQYEASCVMPASATAKTSVACTTGAAIPAGGFPVGTAGRLLMNVCTPFCAAATDTDGDGFGFELGGSCVVKASVPAARGLDCKLGQPDPTAPPITLNPSPPRGEVTKPATVSSRGFFVANGRLYDKFGNDFVMRGVNSAHIWFDVSDQYFAYNALDNMAALGVNTVRIVWETTGSPVLLRQVLRRVVELRMIPMIELHNATSMTTAQWLLDMATYYARPDVKAVLLDYEEFLLVNIANEWSGPDAIYRSAYQSAVTQLRSAGIQHTLVIDANGFGQNAAAIMTDGAALSAADPQHNLLFSVHMYSAYDAAGGGRTKITQTLEQAVAARLPFIVGEFGWQFGMPAAPIDAAFIMSECARLRLGYLAWSWKGNDATLAYLDMAVDWEGATLTTWGADVIRGASGITATARRASIFGP